MDTSSARKEMLERKKVKKKMSKAQMQLAIIKKKQCDAKALAIVEQLLEPKIDSEWLLCNLSYINKSHMEDVIEERAIIKLCGYVLCDKALTTIIDQRYHISTKKNKVYDVTRRKNFCSARCYGASNYLLEQMLTSPLWLRDKEEVPEFKVLATKDELEKSIPGDEIHVGDINAVLNSTNKDEWAESNTNKNSKNTSFNTCLEVNANHECSIESSQTEMNNIVEGTGVLKEQSTENFDEKSEDVQNMSPDLENKNDSFIEFISDNTVANLSTSKENMLLDCTVNKNTKGSDKDVVSLKKDVNQKDENKEHKDSVDKLDMEDNVIITKAHATNSTKDRGVEMEKGKSKVCKQRTSINDKKSSEFYNLAMHIEQSVKEWITEDTICLLSGEEDVKNRLLDNILRYDRYLHLCKKLNKLQLEDEKDDYVDLTTNSLKPLPHLSVLREEGKKMELKVRAFYKGSVIIDNSESISEGTKEDNNFTPVLPLTDAHAPKTLRRRIFLDKLNRILPDLLRALASNKLLQYVYSSEKSALIKALVTTFSLSATNIMFKTAEWTLVGLIIIKMLSMMDPQLKFLLASKQATMYISMILMSYKLDSNYLERLVMELTNNTEISNTDNGTNRSVV